MCVKLFFEQSFLSRPSFVVLGVCFLPFVQFYCPMCHIKSLGLFLKRRHHFGRLVKYSFGSCRAAMVSKGDHLGSDNTEWILFVCNQSTGLCMCCGISTVKICLELGCSIPWAGFLFGFVCQDKFLDAVEQPLRINCLFATCSRWYFSRLRLVCMGEERGGIVYGVNVRIKLASPCLLVPS